MKNKKKQILNSASCIMNMKANNIYWFLLAFYNKYSLTKQKFHKN